MELPRNLTLDQLTPSRLWSEMDPQTRLLAAQSVYDEGSGDGSMRGEANDAIASALRFRPTAVRRLPVEKRIDYLARAVRPDDSLAQTLLIALHLTHRTELLGAFLDDLGIPQENGLIDSEHELSAPEPQRLASAVCRLRGVFPDEEIDLYLASLLAMDPDNWGGLAEILAVQQTG